VSRARDLADLGNNAGGLETLTVSDITDLTATATELNYVNGVGSAIQTQLDAKLATSTASSTYAPLASPDFTGTVDLTGTTISLDNDQISGDKVSGGTIGAGTFNGTIGSSATGFTGVKIADQWRLTSGFTDNKDPIDSNLERVDSTAQGTIGSAMTESSGVFTFPMTGIYYIEFVQSLFLNGNSAYVAAYIRRNISGVRGMLTRNYSFITSFSSSGNIYTQVVASTLFDCSNVSTHKVEFSSAEKHNPSIQTIGSSGENNTYMTFVRLGDT